MPIHVIGADEVGTGAWAGPIAVCAFAAPNERWYHEGLRDSKQIKNPNTRRRIAHELMREYPEAFEIVLAYPDVIDALGLKTAWAYAMEMAVYQLIVRVGEPAWTIVDGNQLPFEGVRCESKADGKYPCVMAASVIAKNHRDTLMYGYAHSYPKYGFKSHVGYGTPNHHEALRRFGLTPIHRRSTNPMCKMVIA